MRLYNSLTRQIEELKPIEKNKIRFYSCGQTIYLDVHIGNARTYSFWDVLVRYLRWRGYDVFWVQNFTDVGHLTDDALEFYKQFDNVEVVSSPWEDSYIKQYQAFTAQLKDGEWCLYLDCDEIPSPELIEACKMGPGPVAGEYLDLFRLPCVLHLTEDGKKYYPVEKPPVENWTGQWTKNILFKKSNQLTFRHFGSHVIPEVKNNRYSYINRPYYHMKSLKSFVYNDVWQAFLHPEGQGYTPIEAAQFKMFTKQYKTTAEFKKATLSGCWPVALQNFARKHSRDFNRPISRLSWVYYLLENNIDVLSDGNMMRHDTAKSFPGTLEMMVHPDTLTWDYVKQYVLGKETMELFNENMEKGNFIEIT